jgi:carbohydrate kinase (thermoresistant glucokinase family)
MKAGIPLTDADRQPWLEKIHEIAKEHSLISGAVIACSALKKKYRDQLSAGIHPVSWFFLKGDFSVIMERLRKRENHFMPVKLLQSQFDSLQVPENACELDINDEPGVLAKRIIDFLSSSS